MSCAYDCAVHFQVHTLGNVVHNINIRCMRIFNTYNWLLGCTCSSLFLFEISTFKLWKFLFIFTPILPFFSKSDSEPSRHDPDSWCGLQLLPFVAVGLASAWFIHLYAINNWKTSLIKRNHTNENFGDNHCVILLIFFCDPRPGQPPANPLNHCFSRQNDPIENQDYYISTPVPKVSRFAPGINNSAGLFPAVQLWSDFANYYNINWVVLQDRLEQ